MMQPEDWIERRDCNAAHVTADISVDEVMGLFETSIAIRIGFATRPSVIGILIEVSKIIHRIPQICAPTALDRIPNIIVSIRRARSLGVRSETANAVSIKRKCIVIHWVTTVL